MTLVVTALDDNKYEIELSAPEESWLTMLASKLISDKVTMLAAAVNFGLIDMLRKYLPSLPIAEKEPSKQHPILDSADQPPETENKATG